jgi:hypothetical protein
LKSLFILGAPGKDSPTVVDVSVDDHECVGVVGTGDLELARISFALAVAEREEETSMVVVEDLVRDAGSIDASEDLHVCTAEWFG